MDYFDIVILIAYLELANSRIWMVDTKFCMSTAHHFVEANFVPIRTIRIEFPHLCGVVIHFDIRKIMDQG